MIRGFLLSVLFCLAISVATFADQRLQTPRPIDTGNFKARCDLDVMDLGLEEVEIQCVVRCVSGFQRLTFPVATEKNPACLYVFDSDRQYVGKCALSTGAARSKDGILITGDNAIGVRIALPITKRTIVDDKKVIQSLSRGRYLLQWETCNSFVLDDSRSGTLNGRSDILSIAIPGIKSGRACIANNDLVYVEARLPADDLRVGEMFHVQFKVINKGEESVSLFNPFLHPNYGSRANVMRFVIKDSSGKRLGDLLEDNDGSRQRVGSNALTTLPKNGVVASRKSFVAGCVPGLEYVKGRELPIGDYHIQLECLDRLVLSNSTLDKEKRFQAMETLLQTSSGKVVARSEQVLLRLALPMR